MNSKISFSTVCARQIILVCAIIAPASSMHAVSHRRAKLYTMLATALPLPLILEDPATALMASATFGGMTRIFCFTPTDRLEKADESFKSIHDFITDKTFFTNPESLKEKEQFYAAIENHFACSPSPLIAAKKEFNSNILEARSVLKEALQAKDDLAPDEKDLAERCTQVIEKAHHIENKALTMVQAINKHPDYNKHFKAIKFYRHI